VHFERDPDSLTLKEEPEGFSATESYYFARTLDQNKNSVVTGNDPDSSLATFVSRITMYTHL